MKKSPLSGDRKELFAILSFPDKFLGGRMNKKIIGNILKVFVLVMLVFAVSGCDGLFDTYTVKVRSYITSTWVFIQYRESGATEWKNAALNDENGDRVSHLVYQNSSYEDTAYFDLPGAGTYDFRAVDILGGLEGDGILTDCEIKYSREYMDDLYGHNISISNLSSIHDFY